MAEEVPDPTPEGVLLKRVRESLRPRVTVAEVAQRAGVSPEMWGHIERGHRSAGKAAGRVPVRAKAATLAHMAFEVGVSVQELKDTGRVDAAEILAQMEGASQKPELEAMDVAVDSTRVFFAVPPDMSDEDREAVKQLAEEWAVKLNEARRSGPKGA